VLVLHMCFSLFFQLICTDLFELLCANCVMNCLGSWQEGIEDVVRYPLQCKFSFWVMATRRGAVLPAFQRFYLPSSRWSDSKDFWNFDSTAYFVCVTIIWKHRNIVHISVEPPWKPKNLINPEQLSYQFVSTTSV
jgi:hypothetical protein